MQWKGARKAPTLYCIPLLQLMWFCPLSSSQHWKSKWRRSPTSTEIPKSSWRPRARPFISWMVCLKETWRNRCYGSRTACSAPARRWMTSMHPIWSWDRNWVGSWWSPQWSGGKRGRESSSASLAASASCSASLSAPPPPQAQSGPRLTILLWVLSSHFPSTGFRSSSPSLEQLPLPFARLHPQHLLS